MYYYGYDPTALLIIPALILSIYAQYKVNSNFKKYSAMANKLGYTGADVANQLLMLAGIRDVKVQPIAGELTDNYNPSNKTLNLSSSVYNSTSIAAIGVAAHETGHAIQDHNGYYFLKVRSAIFPVVNFSSKLAIPIIMIGLLLARGGLFLLNFGIFLFCFVVLFQLITLPVEFNASSHAIKLLSQNNFLSENEITPVKKVLGAAALTYVAAAAASILNLLRFILIANTRNRD